MEKSSFT